MNRLCVILIAMTMLWGAPSPGWGQGLLTADGPAGLAALPSSFQNSVSCRNGGGSGLFSLPSLYFGWLEYPRGSVWALQRQATTGTAAWPLKGFWLGATKEVTFDAGPGFLISGGVFLPRRVSGTWFTSPETSAFSFEIPSYDWWYVDGLVKGRVCGNFELLAGFRWDHTSTRVNYSDNTTDDYVLNSYMPLVGTQMYQPFSNGSMLVRVVYSPLVFGTLKYNFWTRTGFSEFGDFSLNTKSSFLEILADYQLKLTGDLRVGAFAKWNWLRVRTNNHNLSGSTTESVAWGVDIRSLTVGGEVSLAFSSPF